MSLREINRQRIEACFSQKNVLQIKEHNNGNHQMSNGQIKKLDIEGVSKESNCKLKKDELGQPECSVTQPLKMVTYEKSHPSLQTQNNMLSNERIQTTKQINLRHDETLLTQKFINLQKRESENNSVLSNNQKPTFSQSNNRPEFSKNKFRPTIVDPNNVN